MSQAPKPASSTKGHPVPATADLDTSARNYEDFVRPIWRLCDALEVRLPNGPTTVNVVISILKAMRETHEAMRAILRDAQAWEKESQKQTGEHADAILLARPQVESVFIGLLLLHDWEKYERLYRKAAWAAGVRHSQYMSMRLASTPAGTERWLAEVKAFQQMAGPLGITEVEARATLADLTGEVVAENERQHRIRPLPDPSEITHDKRRLLAGSPFEPLGDLLWHQWKFLCDPSHVGLRLLALKCFLRGDPTETPTPVSRDSILQHDVIYPSVVISAVSQMTLASAVVVKNFLADVFMMKLCGEAWDSVRTNTVIGSILWDGWAQKALHILDDSAARK